uniref:Uncharacterized protein n=1 Tax=Leersia perrieri TaxID=77586 RepID=A0A0D9XJU6_9ORYZ
MGMAASRRSRRGRTPAVRITDAGASAAARAHGFDPSSKEQMSAEQKPRSGEANRDWTAPLAARACRIPGPTKSFQEDPDVMKS